MKHCPVFYLKCYVLAETVYKNNTINSRVKSYPENGGVQESELQPRQPSSDNIELMNGARVMDYIPQ